MKKLISIVGPTAIGKTSISIELAKQLNTEILSSDSRQMFKEMAIGTAKPSPEEMIGVKHHFVDSHSIHDDMSVGIFEKDGLATLLELFEKHDTVVMVGGSGLYVRAIVEGFDDIPKVNPEIRATLKARLEKEPLSALADELKKLDPVISSSIDLSNTQRVIRALEVCIGTQRPFSSFLNSDKKKRDFELLSLGIEADRPLMYDRINQRVDLMIEAGLLEEVKSLHPHKSLLPLQTVGYKELFEHMEGNLTLDEAIELIKRNTRRFAKRQMTWFKKDDHTQWYDRLDSKSLIETALQWAKH